MFAIKNISATEKLNSDGGLILEVVVELDGGHKGIYFYEKYLKDDLKKINDVIFKTLKDKDVRYQNKLDKIMLTSNLQCSDSAIFAVSMAIANAASVCCNLPFYRYLGGVGFPKNVPKPILTILTSKDYVSLKTNIKEFLLIPVGFKTFSDSFNGLIKVFGRLKHLLQDFDLSKKSVNSNILELNGDEKALELICDAINDCGYVSGEHFFIGLNVAVSEWKEKNSKYKLPNKNDLLTSKQIGEYLFNLCQKYPIISIKDPLKRKDFLEYMNLMDRLDGVQIVEDGIFLFLPKNLQIDRNNNTLKTFYVDLNSVKTFSEIINLVNFFKDNGYNIIMQYKNIGKKNNLIADLTIGLGVDQIKIEIPQIINGTYNFNRFLELEDYFFKNNLEFSTNT